MMKTKSLASLTRRLVELKGGYRVSHLLINWHLRKHRPLLQYELMGFNMLLDPQDYVDQELLFHPQLYEAAEMEYVRTHLHSGDTFVDIGSHVGAYSLLASRLVGDTGRVVAVDADPRTFARLRENLQLNDVTNVQPFNCGVLDKEGFFPLYHDSGRILNSGANTMIPSGDTHDNKWIEVCKVPCMTLLDLLSRAGLESVTGLKLDIERAEYTVLSCFLANAPVSLLPAFILFEEYESTIELAGGSVARLLESSGHYRRVVNASMKERDHIFERSAI